MCVALLILSSQLGLLLLFSSPQEDGGDGATVGNTVHRVMVARKGRIWQSQTGSLFLNKRNFKAHFGFRG